MGAFMTNDTDPAGVVDGCDSSSTSLFDSSSYPFADVIPIDKACVSTFACRGASFSFQVLMNTACNNVSFNCKYFNGDKSDNYTLVFNQTMDVGPLRAYSSKCTVLCKHGYCDDVTCKCDQGYKGNDCSQCDIGYEAPSNGSSLCQDINECVRDTSIQCQEHSTCFNTPGSYQCRCIDGFEMSGSDCIDINECEKNKDICGTSLCENTVGSYVCQCRPGYTYISSNNSCLDIDECETGTSVCGEGFVCKNIDGSYACVCSHDSMAAECQSFPTVSRVQSIGHGQVLIEGTGSNLTGSPYSPGNYFDLPVLFKINNVSKIVGTFKGPFIESVISAPTDGGLIQVNVTGLEATDGKNITMVIGEYDCNVTVINTNLVGCQVPQGWATPLSMVLTSNGQYSTGNKQFEYLPPSISFLSSLPQRGGNLTIDGSSFGSNQSTSPSTNISDLVSVSVSGRPVADPMILLYEQEYKCDNETCSNNGYCIFGVCNCNTNWTGHYCNETYSSSEGDNNNGWLVIPSNSTPTSTITSDSTTSYEINICEIKELGPDSDQPFVDYDLKNFNWTKTNMSSTNQWRYQLVLPNSAVLDVYITQSADASQFTFGNVQMSTSRNSLKYTISITDWPFESKSNHLELVFQSETFVKEVPAGCQQQPSITEYGTNNNGSNSGANSKTNNNTSPELLWFKTSDGMSTLFARFLNKGILDGVWKTIRFSSVSNGTSLSPSTTTSSSSTSTGLVGISLLVPYFAKNCTVDPDYTLIINPTNEQQLNCNPTSSILDNSIFLSSAIVILVFIAAAAIGSLTWYLIKQKQRARGEEFTDQNFDGASPPPGPSQISY
ncbi:hypothetical protein SAMD00019534_105160 [Acytostelium subglobosum LB1]|uniref:hypothetical protein n=1 Tax=Acytostelium subglobosum LB1 TaxID=1410327 RepID=UPI0006449CFB|nr:hypothetical protein SAMD00019534_105160 [Acytostelium subglobosum LB1]GAM27341.1 hypothetical protein SAMD00019534_105160 [Acytostelium subglobosum LB1]|eukprot:XP_012749808.1 hypothetical protein SAMD00019534_105160 [Acytostelium subglobosum LB1]